MMTTLHTIGTLVAQSSRSAGADLFWDTTIGVVIKALLGAMGVVTVLVSAVKGFTFVGQGKPGQAVKIVAGAILLCVFLFRPETMNDLISTTGGMVSNVIGQANTIQECAQAGDKGLANCDPEKGIKPPVPADAATR